VLVQFNTVMSLAYGPPALLGLVVRRTPHWSGLGSFAVGLALGSYVTFVMEAGLVTTVVIVVPASVAVFLLSAMLEARDVAHRAGRDRLFERLASPVDVEVELRAVPDPTAEVFRFLSRATAFVGLASLPLMFAASPDDRGIVVVYSMLTLGLAGGLSLVRGARRTPATTAETAS
jgi:hypothetical protein